MTNFSYRIKLFLNLIQFSLPIGINLYLAHLIYRLQLKLDIFSTNTEALMSQILLNAELSKKVSVSGVSSVSYYDSGLVIQVLIGCIVIGFTIWGVYYLVNRMGGSGGSGGNDAPGTSVDVLEKTSEDISEKLVDVLEKTFEDNIVTVKNDSYIPDMESNSSSISLSNSLSTSVREEIANNIELEAVRIGSEANHLGEEFRESVIRILNEHGISHLEENFLESSVSYGKDYWDSYGRYIAEGDLSPPSLEYLVDEGLDALSIVPDVVSVIETISKAI